MMRGKGNTFFHEKKIFSLSPAPLSLFKKSDELFFIYRHCPNFCENFSKLIRNTILFMTHEAWFGNIHKKAYSRTADAA